MAINWQISGEAGKSLDEVKRSFPDWKAKQVNLTVGNLEDDKLRFVQSFADPAEVVNFGVDEGQKVEVWRDGVRMFSGVVSKKRVKESVSNILTITVEVAGAWWWMRNTSLSGDMTDGAGGTKERLKFVLDEGLLDVHLGTVIDRAIALGVPIQKGTIAGCYTVPQISITNQSCANAIAELLRWVPDATAWFDYSGAGDPKLNISRRLTAGVFTLTAGVDGELQGYDLQPRLDLKVDEVKVSYVQRDVQWRTVFEEQVSGAATADRPGRQIVAISGPELGDFLPRDEFDSTEIVTSDFTNDANVVDILYAFTKLQEIEDAYGSVQQFGYPLFMTPSGNTILQSGWANLAPFQFMPQVHASPTAPKILSKTGEDITASHEHVLLAGEAKEWLAAYGINVQPATMKGTFSVGMKQAEYNDLTQDSLDYLNEVLAELGMGDPVYYNATGNPPYSSMYWSAELAIDCFVSDVSVGALTTYYRKADYGFIEPPADLAANLLAAQNWTPYEGTVNLKHAEALGQTHIGQVLNLAGSLPEYATMKAPIQRVDYSIDTGDTSITVGAPARMNIAGLVQRFRRSPQDNIVMLG